VPPAQCLQELPAKQRLNRQDAKTPRIQLEIMLIYLRESDLYLWQRCLSALPFPTLASWRLGGSIALFPEELPDARTRQI
jgi:hypothetical protein